MKYLLLFSAILIISCSDELLKMKKTSLIPSNFRTDGYYYWGGENNSQCIIFYTNGVLYDLFNSNQDNLINTDKYIQTEECQIGRKHHKYHWGLFTKENNNLMLEKWLIGDGGCQAAKFQGKIINDTTILIYGRLAISLKSSMKKNTNHIDTLRFRHLDKKPDSTNLFIN
jgi:hypothetical protein